MESTTWTCRQTPDELLTLIHTQMGNTPGVDAVNRLTPTSLEVRARARPGWTIAVAILFFPIGLLALMVKSEARTLLFRVEPGPDGGSLLHVDGATVPSTHKTLVALWHSLGASVPEESSSVH